MILPAHDYRQTRITIPGKLHQGLDGALNGLIGRHHRRSARLRELMNEAEEISERAEGFRQTSEGDLKGTLRDLKRRFKRQKKGYDTALPEALAALVEAAHRTLGLRAYTVQIAGALALYRGSLAEMATGEGKSLTLSFPAVLAAWTGRPCHVVTVNDYLADRDASEIKPFYTFCGVSVGSVTSIMEPDQRRQSYAKGIVYTTSKELLADYLRDRLIMGHLHNSSRRVIRTLLFPSRKDSGGIVMRGLDTAIVDEADSVLIDEAVTPLIISRPQENKPFTDVCTMAGQLAEKLVQGQDYSLDLKYQELSFTKKGLDSIGDLSETLPGVWQSPERREELIRQAVTAREYYRPDKQYVVQDGKVVIVDEFTGRLMPNRTWRQGLHQAIEAKEGLELTNPSETLARLSFQLFFRFFRKLCGMTGTGSEAAGEFWHIYALPVIKIPTNRPCIRKVSPNQIFPDAEKKWDAVVKDIETVHKSGRPVLVGTRSVLSSEKLAARLTQRGLDFNLLNAVKHQEEAGIIRSAGEAGRITIATNMAGRGTDIKLGAGVADIGGLHVIATERHESGRIDRQLAGRSARQGDPGSFQAYMCLDDELVERFVPDILRLRLATAVRNGRPGAVTVGEKMFSGAQFAAQRMAFKQRKSVMKMDTWLDEALAFTGDGAGF